MVNRVKNRLFLFGKPLGLGWSRRLRLAILGWIILELALAKLIAVRFGWGPVVVLHALKGGVGLLLCGLVVMHGFRRLGRWLQAPERSDGPQRLGFHVASAVLMAIPGLVPMLVGIALFSPSMRAWLSARFGPQGRDSGPREIDLDIGEWRETRKPKRLRKAISRKPTLEGEPPSV